MQDIPEHDLAFQTALYLQQMAPNLQLETGLVLGSGAGHIAELIQNPIIMPYADLPGMRSCQVAGHQGKLYLGQLGQQTIACFRGRNHLYEGHAAPIIRTPIRTLKLLGADTVILIAAVGSLNPALPVGSLVLIHDHINFQFSNPLVGENEAYWGDRFPSLEHAYDPSLRRQLLTTAQACGVGLKEGVYLAVLGPSFETPAEIRAFRTLGADVVGMSTVAEVIVARHCGLKVAAIAMVTNMAVGLSDEVVNHAGTLAMAEQASADLACLLQHFFDVTYVR
ncbi:MAG: purine-nucleoside phosphorylase [Gammaproteobacteria bacterium]